MTRRSGFLFTLQMAIMAMIPVFPAAGVTARCPGRLSSPASETLVFTGDPISDPMGNVVGVTIPLKRAGRLFLLEGTLDQQTGNFILDTGASGLVLNKTYFRNAICVQDVEGGGVTGSIGEICRLTVKRLQVAEFSYQNISADVIPLGHLENRRGFKILGLFGMSLMKNLEMVIDLPDNQLQLFRLDRNGNRLGGMKQPEMKYDIFQKITEYRNIMFVKATVGGKLLDFCLDTGAESNVFSTDAPKKSLGTVSITRRSNLSGSGQNRGEVLYGTLNDFILGSRQISPMETILCNLTDMARKYEYPIDGMLGYDFFSKGKICINLVKNEMGICLRPEEKK